MTAGRSTNRGNDRMTPIVATRWCAVMTPPAIVTASTSCMASVPNTAVHALPTTRCGCNAMSPAVMPGWTPIHWWVSVTRCTRPNRGARRGTCCNATCARRHGLVGRGLPANGVSIGGATPKNTAVGRPNDVNGAAVNPHDFTPPPGCYLPDLFWEHHWKLGLLHDAAHNRMVVPDAVLVAVMCRVATLIDYRWVLPPIVGGVGSLNFIGGLIGPPGRGKSSANAIAAEIVPFDDSVIYRNTGSGEGIAAVFMKEQPKNVPDDFDPYNRAAMFYVDEGAILAKVDARQGSTFAETLRTAAHGGQLGQQNGNKLTTRHVPAHNYRFTMLAGFQPTNAGPFIDRDAEGTPQRFVWAPAVGGNIPAPGDEPPWPANLSDLNIPAPIYERQPLIVVDTITREVKQTQWEIITGRRSIAGIDAHRQQERVRLAALLALYLEGATTVTDEHWALAGVWSDASRAIRNYTVEWWQATQLATMADKAMTDGHMSAVKADARADFRIDRVARKIAKVARDKFDAGESFVPNVAMLTGEDRPHLLAGRELAVNRGWVKLVNGTRCVPGDVEP